MKSTTDLVKKFKHLPVNMMLWQIWKYELIHKCKVGKHLEIRHVFEHINKLSNPDSILRIKRNLENGSI